MGSIESLIEQVKDESLRIRIAREIAELKKRTSWGLVFERHLPENTRLLVAPINVGTPVWERRSAKPRRFVVRAIEGDELVVSPEAPKTIAAQDATTERIARSDVLIEHDLAHPIYPALTRLDPVRNGPDDRPSHAVIQGENYDALQLLLAPFERQVDVIYIDPPYNTGNKDWAYNNDYVDPNDTYRPSKWLAFMERRLRLARRLLNPDGVIVVTIDENEVHHLGMLLEQMFPEARVQMASIVINPIGQSRGGLSRVDEQAFFVFFGDAPDPAGLGDDFLNERPDTKRSRSVRWEWLIRGGQSQQTRSGPGLFYPVLIDEQRRCAVGVGSPLEDGHTDLPKEIDGCATAWPIRTDGSRGYWRIGPPKLKRLIEKGYVRLGGFDQHRGTWTILYVSDSTAALIDEGVILVTGRDANGVVQLDYAEPLKPVAVKTVWNRLRHNAGINGSHMLTTFVGDAHRFSYPKSLYAVEDTLAILTRKNKDAVVLDFFAGSGTTLHATMHLNSQDGGSRRCLVVTNNEVKAEVAASLMRADKFRGDPEFETAGVFEGACRPRARAAVLGSREDGTPIDGEYLDGRPYADGFDENVEFFRIDYLDPAEVEFGLRYRELEPLIWLWAGGIGGLELLDPEKPLGVPGASPYAVLFDPAGMRDLLACLAARPEITHVFIVAESEDAFSQLASELPPGMKAVSLYRDYLDRLRRAGR